METGCTLPGSLEVLLNFESRHTWANVALAGSLHHSGSRHFHLQHFLQNSFPVSLHTTALGAVLEDPDRLVERVVKGRDIIRWDIEGERVERIRRL